MDSHRSSRRAVPTTLVAAVMVLLAAACGDDGEAGAGAGSSSSGGGGATSSTASTGTSAGGGDGAGGGTGSGGGALDCSDAAACAYPLRGLEVTERPIQVTDATTGRTLPVLARVPDGAGPLPLVIWSHGGGFQEEVPASTATWSVAFAQQGYAVLTIAHVAPTAETGPELCALASIPVNDCVVDGGDEDDTGMVALVKTRDVIAVLDALPALSEASVEAGGPAIDLDRILLAGWSAGSRSALVSMGATFVPLPGMDPFSMTDARPTAALALSPAGPGFGGFYEDDGGASSWSEMRGPTLVITGDNDVKETKPGLNGPVRRRAFEAQPADGARWMLYSNLEPGVGGHDTYNLGSRDSSDERLADLSIAIASSALAFADAHLLDDPDARAWLDSDKARLIAGEAEWENR